MCWIWLASQSCFKGLNTLDLSTVDMTNRMDYVAEALRGGRLEGLEELTLNYASVNGLCAIFAALRHACPRVRRLDLTGLKGRVDVAAEVLESAHLHQLQELVLSKCGATAGAATVIRALQAGAFPGLVELDLSSCDLSPGDGVALGEAMISGHCVRLERLGLEDNRRLDGEGFVAIFGALEAGSCPYLKRLELTHAHLSPETATAFGNALQSGYCHHLQRLDL